jgi:quercetin dioxygenase-like cupin family protein
MKIIPAPDHGAVIDATDTPYPSRLRVLTRDTRIADAMQTTYGYVLEGAARVGNDKHACELSQGGFFAVPGGFTIEPAAVTSRVVIIERFGFRGVLTFGAVESQGRLSYIDGCSDSMLVYPPRMGDPVFNHLHFPPGIVQTQHTHPTIRLGIVSAGAGHAFGPVTLGAPEKWHIELSPGSVFLLEPQEMHSFRTDMTPDKRGMDVIAYHPDSDWGPTDTAHPMRNRTYIGANPFNTGG